MKHKRARHKLYKVMKLKRNERCQARSTKHLQIQLGSTSMHATANNTASPVTERPPPFCNTTLFDLSMLKLRGSHLSARLVRSVTAPCCVLFSFCFPSPLFAPHPLPLISQTATSKLAEQRASRGASRKGGVHQLPFITTKHSTGDNIQRTSSP